MDCLAVNANINLISLLCRNNSIISLDVSNNKELIELKCDESVKKIGWSANRH